MEQVLDERITVYLNDGSEWGFLNHTVIVDQGVMRLVSEDNLEITIYPLASIHHTFTEAVR